MEKHGWRRYLDAVGRFAIRVSRRRLVADPTAPNTLYAATRDAGIFKSLDGGVTWNKASGGIATTRMQALAIDPLHPQVLYAATGAGVNPGRDL